MPNALANGDAANGDNVYAKMGETPLSMTADPETPIGTNAPRATSAYATAAA